MGYKTIINSHSDSSTVKKYLILMLEIKYAIHLVPYVTVLFSPILKCE